jgi:hypothetical protein
MFEVGTFIFALNYNQAQDNEHVTRAELSEI